MKVLSDLAAPGRSVADACRWVGWSSLSLTSTFCFEGNVPLRSAHVAFFPVLLFHRRLPVQVWLCKCGIGLEDPIQGERAGGNAEENAWKVGGIIGSGNRNDLELPQHGRALRWRLEMDGMLGIPLGGKGHVVYRDGIEERTQAIGDVSTSGDKR